MAMKNLQQSIGAIFIMRRKGQDNEDVFTMVFGPVCSDLWLLEKRRRWSSL